jgi:hypothetical protein
VLWAVAEAPFRLNVYGLSEVSLVDRVSMISSVEHAQ